MKCQHCKKSEAQKKCCISKDCQVCEPCWWNCEGLYDSCPSYDWKIGRTTS